MFNPPLIHVLFHAYVQEGQIYNAEDSRKALRDVFDLNLFENVQVGGQGMPFERML